MRRPARGRLQLDDCPLDPQPHEPAFGITAFTHLIGSLGSHDLSILAVLLHKEIGRAPDVDVRGYRHYSTTGASARNIWTGTPAETLVRL